MCAHDRSLKSWNITSTGCENDPLHRLSLKEIINRWRGRSTKKKIMKHLSLSAYIKQFLSNGRIKLHHHNWYSCSTVYHTRVQSPSFSPKNLLHGYVVIMRISLRHLFFVYFISFIRLFYKCNKYYFSE